MGRRSYDVAFKKESSLTSKLARRCMTRGVWRHFNTRDHFEYDVHVLAPRSHPPTGPDTIVWTVSAPFFDKYLK